MSQPDESSQEALRRLNKRLEALQADRAPQPGSRGGSAERSMGEGYRLMGEVIGGVLGGLGLGWVFDHFAHTTPWAMVAGLLLGTALSAYAAMKSADRMGRQASVKPGPAPDVAGDDDEDA
ncbi:MAG: AtpZ/AtpI family protein [Caulobacterales bacterium]